MPKAEKNNTLYMGTFNSEYFWRDEKFSSLPSFADQQADAIVSVMDELQFVFCTKPNDVLITRLPMDATHKDYLCNLGFVFSNNKMPPDQRKKSNTFGSTKSICQLLIETTKKEYFKKIIHPKSKLSPYSILPFSHNVCSHYNIQNRISTVEVARKVNSKIYSCQLAKNLFEDTVGQIANSAMEVKLWGDKFLRESPFLIKDAFGVSGKGNILIASVAVLKHIVKHLVRQEKQGKKTQFVIEPFRDKHIDFSCLLEIDMTGAINIVSIQQMQNKNFAFSRLKQGDIKLRQKLENSEYFGCIEKIAKQLHKEKYFGPVCIDSMILRNGDIVPIIEINARKSMGFINHYVDKFLIQFSTGGRLTYLSFGMSRNIKFEEILHKMSKKGILFQKKSPAGVLPLSANTLLVNQKPTQPENPRYSYKGRLYLTIVSQNDKEYEQILNQVNQIFIELGAKCFTQTD